jgi:hypothetical protein
MVTGPFEELKSPDVKTNNGGKKYDAGKAPLLRGCLAYFSRALVAVSQISEYGANKYDNHTYEPNWAKVENGLARYSDADARHLLAEAVDGLYDPESKMLHAAHHAWNALARLEFLLKEHTIKRPDEPTTNSR